jgi:hypothetical protein
MWQALALGVAPAGGGAKPEPEIALVKKRKKPLGVDSAAADVTLAGAYTRSLFSST